MLYRLGLEGQFAKTKRTFVGFKIGQVMNPF